MKSPYTLALLAIFAWFQTGRPDTAWPALSTIQIKEPLPAAAANHLDAALYYTDKTPADSLLAAGQPPWLNLNAQLLQPDRPAGTDNSYFFKSNFGMAEGPFYNNTRQPLVNNPAGNVIYRLPTDGHYLTPYFYGGVGYRFDTAQQPFGQTGAGAEMHLLKNLGLFLDARYGFTDGPDKYSLGQAGLQFSF